jgi:hypothetical protein
VRAAAATTTTAADEAEDGAERTAHRHQNLAQTDRRRPSSPAADGARTRTEAVRVEEGPPPPRHHEAAPAHEELQARAAEGTILSLCKPRLLRGNWHFARPSPHRGPTLATAANCAARALSNETPQTFQHHGHEYHRGTQLDALRPGRVRKAARARKLFIPHSQEYG